MMLASAGRSAVARTGMTEIDAVGPDGRVRLWAYLPSANSLWFAAGCQSRQGCGHSAPIGIWATIALMGPEATVGELERRLRCSQCGNRKVGVTVHPDTRPHGVGAAYQSTCMRIHGQPGLSSTAQAISRHSSMDLFQDQPPPTSPPAKLKLTSEERRARYADRLTTIRLRMLIGQELDERGITTPAAIGEALGMSAAEATSLMTRHQRREGDVARLEAAAARLGVQVPGL
jgi:hypothetical protein